MSCLTLNPHTSRFYHILPALFKNQDEKEKNSLEARQSETQIAFQTS